MLQPSQKSKKSRIIRRNNRSSSTQRASVYDPRKKSNWLSFLSFLPFISNKSSSISGRNETLSRLRSQQGGRFSSQFSHSSSTGVKVFSGVKAVEDEQKNEADPSKSSEESSKKSSSTESDINNSIPARLHKHVVEQEVSKTFYKAKAVGERAVESGKTLANFLKNPLQFIQHSVLNLFDFLNQQQRYWFMKFGILRKINVLISSFLLIVSVLFVSYISFFDTYFLVKNYQIEFQDKSYLSESDTQQLLSAFQQNNLLGVLPGNQLWFFNNQHLTQVAQKLFPDIEYVYIQKRIWPNTAVLSIKTNPILLTLRINEDQYWRISQSGDVLTKDDIRMKERLVMVRNEIVINSQNQEAFQDYSFKQDIVQKEKFWFIDWLWQEMDTIGVKYAETQMVSLYDTDVIIKTTSGTELRFDSRTFSRTAQQQRLTAILGNTTISDSEKNNQLSYIDFRIPGKVFVCRKDSECK